MADVPLAWVALFVKDDHAVVALQRELLRLPRVRPELLDHGEHLLAVLTIWRSRHGGRSAPESRHESLEHRAVLEGKAHVEPRVPVHVLQW